MANRQTTRWLRLKVSRLGNKISHSGSGELPGGLSDHPQQWWCVFLCGRRQGGGGPGFYQHQQPRPVTRVQSDRRPGRTGGLCCKHQENPQVCFPSSFVSGPGCNWTCIFSSVVFVSELARKNIEELIKVGMGTEKLGSVPCDCDVWH